MMSSKNLYLYFVDDKPVYFSAASECQAKFVLRGRVGLGTPLPKFYLAHDLFVIVRLLREVVADEPGRVYFVLFAWHRLPKQLPGQKTTRMWWAKMQRYLAHDSEHEEDDYKTPRLGCSFDMLLKKHSHKLEYFKDTFSITSNESLFKRLIDGDAIIMQTFDASISSGQ